MEWICILSPFDVSFISNQYKMDLIWMELRTTHQIDACKKFIISKGRKNWQKLHLICGTEMFQKSVIYSFSVRS